MARRDRDRTTVEDLLEHSSGLSARLIDSPPRGRREFEHDICTMPLEYDPRTQSIYSDLGFILLGFAAADRGGASLANSSSRSSASSARRSAHGRSLEMDVARAARADANAAGGRPRGDACWSAKCTTAMRQPLAASPVTPASSARLRCRCLRPRVAEGGARRRVPAPAVLPAALCRFLARACPRQFARARLGHDADHFVVRHADVGIGIRPRGLYRNVVVDRSRPRPLLRAADQPCIRRRLAGSDADVRRAFHDSVES